MFDLVLIVPQKIILTLVKKMGLGCWQICQDFLLLINGLSYHMIRFLKLIDLLFSMFDTKAYIASYACT